LSATGLEKKTRYSRTTLIIAANIPDIDFVLYFWGDARSYAFRRGVTHGIPALIVLPLLLALVMMLLSRITSTSDARQEASFRWLLVLSAIGVATHPALDWLNNYGMRWLMPMVDKWFYGDTLFIVDWVVWLALAAGLVAAHRIDSANLRWFQKPACISLAFIVTYISISFAITQFAEQVALESSSDDPPLRLMASPVPLNPFEREMVLDYGTEYRFGIVRFSPRPQFEWDEERIAKGDPTVFERARQVREGRWFLHWARFPYVVVEESGGRTLARFADARYVREIDEPRLRSFGVIALEFNEASTGL
jgi:inner membrane protein